MENTNEPIEFTDEFIKAASFLASLGTSMQKRSESVIEKKLTGNKKISISQYQKVAEKLLLICELSKKSIENFEKGLKELLELLCKSGAENGSDLSGHGLTREPKFKVYQYGTTDLKVPLSVNYKYYLSSKVEIVRLATTTFEKYLALHNKNSENNESDNDSTTILPNDSDKPLNDGIEIKCDQPDEKCEKKQENTVTNKTDINSSNLIKPIDTTVNMIEDNNGCVNTNENSNESNETKVSANAIDEKPRLKLVSLQKLLKPDHTVLTVFKDNVKNKLLAEAIHNGGINAKGNTDESPSKKVITIISSDEESVKDKKSLKISPAKSNIIRKRKSRKNTYKEYSSSDISQCDDSDDDYEKKKSKKRKKIFKTDSEESDVSDMNKKTKSMKSSDTDIEISFKQVKKKVRFTFDKNSRPRRESNASNNSDRSLGEQENINEKIQNSNETICVNVETEEEVQIRRKAVAEFKPRELSINIEKMAMINKRLLEKYNLERIIENGSIVVEAERSNSFSKVELLASSDESASESSCSSPIKKRLQRYRPMTVIHSETESDTEDEELVKALEEIRKEIQEMTQRETESENKDASTSDYVTSDEELTKVLSEIKCESKDTIKENKPYSESCRKRSVSTSESSTTDDIKKTVASIERDIQEVILKNSNRCDSDKEGFDWDNTDINNTVNAKDGF